VKPSSSPLPQRTPLRFVCAISSPFVREALWPPLGIIVRPYQSPCQHPISRTKQGVAGWRRSGSGRLAPSHLQP
jgi:hypothetical protein